jgi:signal transduction histidine kinase
MRRTVSAVQHVVKNVTRRGWGIETVIVVAAVAMPLLAMLQYRWLSELAAAQRADLQRGWQAAVDRSAAAINTDVSTFYAAVVVASQEQAANAIAEAIAMWRRTATTLGPFAKTYMHDRARARWVAVEGGGDEPSTIANVLTTDIPYAASWIAPAEARGFPAMVVNLDVNGGAFDAVLLSFDPRACEPLLRSLAARYFEPGSDPHLAVTARGDAGHPPDTRSAVFVLRPPLRPRARELGRASAGIVMAQPGAPAWDLHAQHADEGFATTVRRMQARNWWVAAGLELILVAALVALAVSARRARQVADAHLTFAAVVAHEIRTPLAAIKVLAQNQAHGIVKSDEQVAEYGMTIAAEADRLHEFVERVLRLTAAHR